MPIVKADLDLCEGYANCVTAADDFFDLDDSGVVVVLKATVPDVDRGRAEQAVRSCPVAALSIEDE
jgi:ferredoxin